MDVVNEHLNGYLVRLPEYREYATRQVADTIVTDYAISELIGVDCHLNLLQNMCLRELFFLLK